jgi:hypothetical protein
MSESLRAALRAAALALLTAGLAAVCWVLIDLVVILVDVGVADADLWEVWPHLFGAFAFALPLALFRRRPRRLLPGLLAGTLLVPIIPPRPLIFSFFGAAVQRAFGIPRAFAFIAAAVAAPGSRGRLRRCSAAPACPVARAEALAAANLAFRCSLRPAGRLALVCRGRRRGPALVLSPGRTPRESPRLRASAVKNSALTGPQRQRGPPLGTLPGGGTARRGDRPCCAPSRRGRGGRPAGRSGEPRGRSCDARDSSRSLESLLRPHFTISFHHFTISISPFWLGPPYRRCESLPRSAVEFRNCLPGHTLAFSNRKPSRVPGTVLASLREKGTRRCAWAIRGRVLGFPSGRAADEQPVANPPGARGGPRRVQR